MNLKIAGTVIFYNPDNDVYDNIKSYIHGLDVLYIVDNSTKHNKEIVHKLQESFDNIVYINNNENLGIATALNIACDRAIESNYEWILTMDQDSMFLDFNDYLKCLDNHYFEEDLSIIAANTTRNATNYTQEANITDYKEKFLVITSANFLNLKLFNQIGRFEDKLFIDMVDHDYCMKANSLGYKIYYFHNIMVEHNLGDLFERRNIFTSKLKTKTEHNPQRVYYITRNFLYTWKKYKKRFPNEFNILRTLNILFIHEVTKIIIYEDQKLKKLYAKLLGMYHFAIGKYGKYDI